MLFGLGFTHAGCPTDRCQVPNKAYAYMTSTADHVEPGKTFKNANTTI